MTRNEPFRFQFGNKSGSILVVSLWMISVLAVFSASLGYHVRQKISLADRIDRRNELVGLAETGVYQALFKIRLKKEAEEAYHGLNNSYTSGEDAFLGVRVGEGTFTISEESQDPKDGQLKLRFRIGDEESKININVADAKIISKLFQVVADLDEEEANEIAYSVADWKDSDSSLSHPDYGAEDDYYEDLDLPYDCKDHIFESLNELLLVRGMTQELFERIKPFVTIHGSGAVNINTATREVLYSLGMDESLVDKVTTFRAGSDLEEGTADDGVFVDSANIAYTLDRGEGISPSDESLISSLLATERLGVQSNYFRIQSRGELRHKQQTLEVLVVADIEGKILSWSSGIPRRMTALEIDSLDRKSAQA